MFIGDLGMKTSHDILGKYNLGFPRIFLCPRKNYPRYQYSFQFILYSRNDTRGNMQYNYVDGMPGFYASNSIKNTRINEKFYHLTYSYKCN